MQRRRTIIRIRTRSNGFMELAACHFEVEFTCPLECPKCNKKPKLGSGLPFHTKKLNFGPGVPFYAMKFELASGLPFHAKKLNFGPGLPFHAMKLELVSGAPRNSISS